MMVKTIKSQFTLITLLPMLITLLFISSLMLQQFISNIEGETEQRAQDIASQAAMMSEFYLYTGDVDGLHEVARTLMRIDGLKYVRFIAASGQLLIQDGNSTHDQAHHYTFPIQSSQLPLNDFSMPTESVETEMLGTIDLALTTDESFDRHYHTYKRLLFISLISLFLGVVLILLFNRSLHSAIGNLIQAAKLIEDGKFETRCEENGTGELLEFQRTFNTMAESFEQSESRLKAKIDAATASLLITVDELSQKNSALDKSRQETIELERSKAISDERERIMKDMHDGIGGQLVASLALLEQEPDSPLKANIQQILVDCLNDLRMIINSLNMTNDSLAALLADFKYRMSKKLEQMGITLKWQIADIAEDVQLPPQMGLHLLRILQEAFTNILKHADANEIIFELTETTREIVFKVEDNGHYEPNHTNLNGIGLANMESRARFLSSTLEIKLNQLGGCTVMLAIPLHILRRKTLPPTNEG